jgi:hypothetical protein
MPIWHFQACNRLGLQEQGLLNAAYRQALAALRLVDRTDDPACEVVAHKIRQVYERGVHNAHTLSDIAVGELRGVEFRAKPNASISQTRRHQIKRSTSL